MKTQYVLFLILNDIKRYKDVKKKLIELKYNRFTVIDTIGSTNTFNNMKFSNMFSSTMGETDDKKYNKTLLLVLETEEEVEKIMDEMESTINIDPSKPGKGIMFTIPIIKSSGVRF